MLLLVVVPSLFRLAGIGWLISQLSGPGVVRVLGYSVRSGTESL